MSKQAVREERGQWPRQSDLSQRQDMTLNHGLALSKPSVQSIQMHQGSKRYQGAIGILFSWLLLNTSTMGRASASEEAPSPTAKKQGLLLPSIAHAVSNFTTESFDDLSSLSLENLLNLRVVTASGGAAEDIDLSSANVFVFTHQDIANYGWQSLAEILSYIPGLYVIDDLVSPAVVIRGMSGGFKSATRIIKIMINGIEVNFRSDMTAFLGPEFIPIHAVERVEIAKGPLSSLYGSNAFLATVNVITKRPHSGTHGALGAVLQMRAVRGAGGWGTVSYAGPKTSVFFSAQRLELDRSGLRVQKTFPKQNLLEIQDPTVFASQSKRDIQAPQGAYVNLTMFEPKWAAADFQGGFQQQDANGEFQSASAMTHQSRYSIRNYWSDLKLRTDAFLIKPWIRMGWAEGRPTREDRQYLTSNERMVYRRNFNYKAASLKSGVSYEKKWVQVTAEGEYLREWHRALYFSQIFHSEYGANRPGDQIDKIFPDSNLHPLITNWAAHLQFIVKDVIPNLQLVFDGRIDQSNLYPKELSWRGSLAYRWQEGITTRLILGRAFQGPSAVLLFAIPGFGDTENILGNRAVRGQVPLLPQVVESAELVQVIRLRKFIEIVPSLFWQQFNKTIEFAATTAGYYAKNTEPRRSWGIELTGRFMLNQLQGHLGFSFLHPLATQSGLSKLDKLSAMPFFPTWWISSGLTVPLPKVYLRLTGIARYASQRGPSEQNYLLNDYKPYALPSYVNLDVAISSMNLKIWGPDETVARVLIRNCTNNRQSEPGHVGFDLPVIGRTIVLELNQTF